MKMNRIVATLCMALVSQGNYLSGAGLSSYEQRIKEQTRLNQEFRSAASLKEVCLKNLFLGAL
jgi:hypothetical protein